MKMHLADIFYLFGESPPSMIVNSKIKQKSKTILGVIKNLVLHFIPYFVKYPIHVTWGEGKTQNTLCITWGSKKKLWQTIYNSI